MCSMSVLCPLCTQASFASIDALRLSLVQAANGPLACPICGDMFLGLDKLTIHLFSHNQMLSTTTTTATVNEHSSSVAMTTQEKTLTNSSAEVKDPAPLSIEFTPSTPAVPPLGDAHVLSSPQTDAWSALPTCDVCELNFRSQELLELHFRLVHQNNILSVTDTPQQLDEEPCVGLKRAHDFKCHMCAKTFKMKGSLRVHLRVVHLVGLPAANTAPNLSICDRIRSHQTNTGHSPFQLDSTKLRQQILTLQSNRNVVKMVGPNGEQLLSSKNNNNDQHEHDKDNGAPKGATENTKIWDCDVCAKAFTTKYFLKKHKRLHTGEMPYTCEICTRTFTFQQSYHKHLLYHSDEKPHVCGTCGRAFKELSTLHNHERIHSGEKPFKCEVCGKSFRQRVSFLVHTRIHTGVMPYKCELCQKSFRYKVSQRTHKCLPHVSSIALTSQRSLFDSSPATDSESVDRISENFIKAFLESAAVRSSPSSIEVANVMKSATDMEDLQSEGAKSSMDEAMLSKTIDDIVVESCNKMGIGSTSPTVNSTAERTHSPLLKLENMRLYSPEMTEAADLEQFLIDQNNVM